MSCDINRNLKWWSSWSNFNINNIMKLSDCDLLGPNGPLSLKMPCLTTQANNYVSPVIESQLFIINRTFPLRLCLWYLRIVDSTSLIHAHVSNICMQDIDNHNYYWCSLSRKQTSITKSLWLEICQSFPLPNIHAICSKSSWSVNDFIL